MYATPAVGRPSERETSFRVSSRQEMRSLSPGRGIPLRTSARSAKHSKGSAPEASSLHQRLSAKKQRRGSAANSATLARFVARSGASFGLGRSSVTSWMSNCAPLKSFPRSEAQYGF